MLKRLLLPVIMVLVAVGFWLGPDIKEIAAGVAIFLFGMLFLEQGFRTFTGGVLENLLKRMTGRVWKALAFGFATTTVLQSSSLVSLLTISFLSAGLITLTAGVGIVFGANIGTTTGAWLVAGFGLNVKISAFATPLLVFGVIMVFQKSNTIKGIGNVLAGVGFLFLGIHFMKVGFESFRETIDLAQFAIPGFLGLAAFTLIGVAATVIMQSSHATLVLIITALAAQQITYENALALAIGANIGTTITAIIGSLGANYQGKQLAGAHVIFNLLTGGIAIALIGPFALTVDWIAETIGLAPDNYTMKLAVFHSLFNMMGVIVTLPALGLLVRSLERWIQPPRIDLARPQFLHEATSEYPETAVVAVAKEAQHLYENAYEIMAHGLSLHRADIQSGSEIEDVVARSRRPMHIDLDEIYETKVKVLYAAILEYISQTQSELPLPFVERLIALRHACGLIVESVKEIKHLRKNVSRFMASDNVDIRREYDWIREQLGEIMRLMHEIRLSDVDKRDVLDLDEAKLSFEEEDVTTTGKLDKMIREKKITPVMGTSLMNDLGYARRAVWNLADAGKVVFGAHTDAEKNVEELLTLTDEDVAKSTATASR